MRRPTKVIAIPIALIAVALIAGVAFATLVDSKTASGTVNATSTSPDLYICETGVTAGPACGSDDSGADEAIFESLENIKPGAIIVQDLRLVNTGSETWTVSGVVLGISELADPGLDCPDGTLKFLPKPSAANNPDSLIGVQILGKANDPLNDNTRTDLFPIMLHRLVPGEQERNIRVLSGDFEDVRLLLQMSGWSLTNSRSCQRTELSLPPCIAHLAVHRRGCYRVHLTSLDTTSGLRHMTLRR